MPSCPGQQGAHAGFLHAQQGSDLGVGAAFHLSHVQHRVLGGRQIPDAFLEPLLVLALYDNVQRRGGGLAHGLPLVERERRLAAQAVQGQVARNRRGVALGIVEPGIVTHLPQSQHRLLGDIFGSVGIGTRCSGRLQGQLPQPCRVVFKCVYRHQLVVV